MSSDSSAAICPNCGNPVETHEMFSPPRCPVVRIRWPKLDVSDDPGAVTSCVVGDEPTAASVLDRLLKRSPWRYHHDRKRWASRTYPCSRWWCFRRSPAWRSFERGGRSYCDRHVPLGGDLD